MALADEIAVKLGLNASQFKAALKDAGVEINNFKNNATVNPVVGGVKELRNAFNDLRVLFAAGGMRAVIGFFEDLAETAQKSKDITDENIDSTRRWGEEYAELKKTTSVFFVQTLGFLASIGRNAGDMLSSLWGGLKNVFGPGGFVQGFRSTAYEIIRNNQLEKQTRQDMLETNKTIEQRKLTMKAVADESKRQAEAEKDALRVIRDQSEAAQKLGDAKKELRELNISLLGPEEKSAALAKRRVEIEREIAGLERFVKEGGELTLEGTQQLVGLKKELVSVIGEQAKAESKVTAEVKDQTKELEKQKNALASIAGIRGENQLNDASDAALAEIARRNRNKAQAIQGGEGGFGIGQNLEAARLLSEALNAEKELAFRRDFRQTVSALGENEARARFEGDPLKFDRVLQQFTQTQDKSTTLLQSLDDRLQTAGFGRR